MPSVLRADVLCTTLTILCWFVGAVFWMRTLVDTTFTLNIYNKQKDEELKTKYTRSGKDSALYN